MSTTWPVYPPPRISFITSVRDGAGERRRQRQSVDVLERLHHAQLAMPRGEESAARAFSAGVLGLLDPTDLPVTGVEQADPLVPDAGPELFKRNLTSTRFSQD